MKLVFDQTLSPWLCQRLGDRFPNSVHVREVGLRDAEDAVIWDYAARARAVLYPSVLLSVGRYGKLPTDST